MRSMLVAAVVLVPIGCSAAPEPQCHAGADCVSGVCLGSGTCAPLSPGQDGGAEADDDAEPEESSSGQDAAAEELPDSTPSVCSPNHDGQITRQETPLDAGLHATFKIATNAAVNTAGTDTGGVRTWDFSADLPGDHLSLIELQDLQGAWFAPKFPSASYASRLSDTQDLLGVFQLTDSQLLLLGVVSSTGGVSRTELVYDPPVVTLSFPLQQAATWTTDAKVTGLAMGIVSAYSEKYESQVDAAGELIAPYGTFPVLRIQTLLTRTVNMVPGTMRTFLFVTECFGTVASVSSNANEPQVEFTTASELKRLAP